MRILTCAVFALATAPALAQDPNAGGLKTNVRSDQFTVSWLSSGAVAGTVEWSVNPAGPFTADPDDRGAAFTGTTHHCTVTGLAAGTTYSYRIISGGVVYPTFTITTGPVLVPPVGSVLGFGQIFQSDGITPAAQQVVYLTLSNADGAGSPGSAAPISILTDANGFWFTDLINALLADLSGNFSFSTNGGDALQIQAQGGALGVGSLNIPTQINGGGNIAAPAIVLVADTAPSIGGFAQQTASGALAFGGATTETSVTLLATATDAGDVVKVQIELKPILTPFDGVNYSETALGASPLNGQIAFNGLAAGGYKWQARAVDDAGNASAWMSAPVALPHFTINAPVDTTPPTGGLVNDGTGSDVDSQASTTSISANWSGFVDPQSGIASYEWAIGTTAGGTNVQTYAPVAGTSATNAALALTNGATYFVSVRAINGAGLTGAAVSSDGVTVQAGGPPPPPNSPPTLTNLNQSAPNGGTITVATITLGATVNDVDANTVQLQVEVKPAATAFDGMGLLTSAAAAAGTALQINAGPFATGSYHWRARGIDSSGAQGAWVLYNGAGMDFAVQLNQAPSAPSGLLCEDQTNPAGVLDSTPEFRAVFNDSDAGDMLSQIRIQVATDAAFTNLLWDSGAVNTIPVPSGSLFISTAYALGAADLFWATTHYWRVKCFDGSGAESPWSATATFGMGVPTATLPNANGWQMVAVPSSTAVGLSAALGDDLPAASLAAANEWDEPARSYLGAATIAPMQGLFIPSPALAVDLDTGTAAKGNKVFSADYTTLGGPAGIEAFANQYRGWNLAGNPFASTFDWEGVALASVTPSVYWWDGTQYVFYNAVTDTPPGLNLIPSFRGFWIQALGSGASITIPDPTMFNSPLVPTQPTFSDTSWLLQVSVTGAVAGKDEFNFAGVHPTALDAHDEADSRDLPPLSNPYVWAYFDHPEWGEMAGRYTQDARAPIATGELSWTMTIESTQTQSVTVAFPNVDQMPSGWTYSMIDLATGVSTPIVPGAVVAFDAVAGQPASFEIHATPDGVAASLWVDAGPANPLPSVVPAGATGVRVAQLRLTASLGIVQVNSITFAATGSGDDAAELLGATLMVNGAVLDGPRTFSSDEGTVTFTFQQPLGQADVDLVFDISPAARPGLTFGVALLNVGADAPVYGPAYQSAPITIESQAVVEVAVAGGSRGKSGGCLVFADASVGAPWAWLALLALLLKPARRRSMIVAAWGARTRDTTSRERPGR